MHEPPSPWTIPTRTRRLLAYLYELLPVLAILFVAGALALIVTTGNAVEPGNRLFQAWLLVISSMYFIVSWRRGGQTLAMRPWRLHVRRIDGGRPSWRQVVVRLLIALLGWLPLGLGHLWLLVDPGRRGWHDLAAGTVVLQAPKALTMDS